MTLDAPDAALVAAVTTSDDGAPAWTVAALAAEVGTTPTVVEAIIREGLLRPVRTDPEVLLGAGAADTLRSGMALLEAGLPLGELLDLAGRADVALRDLASHAVDVFLAFVRDPARATSDDQAVAQELLQAFDTMLPAAARLVGDHFRDLVLDIARERADLHG